MLAGNGADVAMHCIPPVKSRRISITLRRYTCPLSHPCFMRFLLVKTTCKPIAHVHVFPTTVVTAMSTLIMPHHESCMQPL